jgi:LEA14-like dessication related protein
MKAAAAIAAIIIVIVVIFLGLLAYSYTQIHVSLNDVKFHSIDWAPISWSTLLKLGLNALTGNWLGAAFDLVNGVNLNLIFGIYNGGILPVYIPDLSYDLYVNHVPVGRGYSTLDLTINPGQSREIPLLQNFQKSSLAPAVSSIVRDGGVMEIRVSGTAYFNLLGLSIPISFESTRSVSIVDEIKSRLNSEIQKNQPRSASPTSTRLLGDTIVDSTYRIPAGTYYSIPLNLSCNARIQGVFVSSATLGDDIIVYVLNANQFNRFKDGLSTSTYYNSGKVETSTFDLWLDRGTYHVVLSNTYSLVSTKNVALKVAGQCN